jgi:predicted glycoside hydrolase/deacetylase ChbG (UPF0249 family)
MTYNPALKKLGFSEQDRVVIIHADDVAVSQASIDAYLELMDFGTISTGSAMTPSSWFPELVRIVRGNPALDMGLHLPVTSEYESYRWRPVSRVDPTSGLVDEWGYFHRKPAVTASQASVQSVMTEVEAQIKLSLKLGLTPTHLDSHHATMLNRRFLRPFVAVAKEYQLLPVMMKMSTMLPRGVPPVSATSEKGLPNAYGSMDLESILEDAENVEEVSQELVEQGVPVPDYLSGMPVVIEGDRLEYAKSLFSAIKPGLTHFAFHPTKDTPETRAITPTWKGRVGDYETFMTRGLKDHLRKEGIQLIGYKTLAALMPQRHFSSTKA